MSLTFHDASLSVRIFYEKKVIHETLYRSKDLVEFGCFALQPLQVHEKQLNVHVECGHSSCFS